MTFELNSANDNPLYDLENGVVRSGGNFSGFHVGLAMDTLQLAVSALTAEALNAANPMTVFSRSTACHNQDKVSMGATAVCTT